MQKEFFIDFHTHTSLKALNTCNNKESKCLWKPTYGILPVTAFERWVSIKTHEIAKDSQANLYKYVGKAIGVVVDALYPVEKEWLQFRKLPATLMGKQKVQDLLGVATGFSKGRINELNKKDDYFEELCEYYDNLVNMQGKSPNGRFSYQLVKDFKEMNEVLSLGKHRLPMMISIEGGHAFGTGCRSVRNLTLKQHKALLSENIATVKGWEFAPLFVTLAHHFWNQLCGHSSSFKAQIKIVLSQSNGMNTGITELGWHVVKELLTTSNGRRIVIDVKHMSIKARMEFYTFIQQNNYINPHDKIPIVCSHAGVNGYQTMKHAIKVGAAEANSNGTYFRNWSINLSQDEIRIIHDSGGVIGLILDKAILASDSTLGKIDRIIDDQKRKEAYLKLFWDNIFFVINAVKDKSAWEVPVLGSDFDGVINHVEFYNDASKLPDLQKDLVQYLEEYNYRKELWFDMNPKTLVSRIFKTNAYEFLRKHF